jgi:glycosyltransferase involved in cell wall biosynthesis
MVDVDVIIPCYNYANFLPECVQSALSQSSVSVRVLILDDCSSDNTQEVGLGLARSDERVTFRRHAVNRGHIYTFNEGIEWTSSKYMLLLSADDYLLPGAFARAVALMEGSPDVGLTFGRSIQLDGDGRRIEVNPLEGRLGGDTDRVLSGCEFIEISGGSNIISTPTAILRTELQKAVGGYRPEFKHTGDMEMWLRFALHASVGYVATAQAVYRRHGSNMSDTYNADYMMPDLKARKFTFDCFFEDNGLSLADADMIRRRVYLSLACVAIGKASSAFNDGNIAQTEEIAEFAVSICPKVKSSLAWRKLAFKRAIGVGGWRVLSSLRSMQAR